MMNFTRCCLLLLLLTGLLRPEPSQAQTNAPWARIAGGWRLAVGGADYVFGVYAAGSSYVISAFDAQGRQRWVRSMTGGRPEAVAADAAGNLWATGSYQGSISSGGLTLVGSGGFLAKYDAQGTATWLRALGPVQGDSPAGQALAVGPAGEVYVAAVGGGSVALPGSHGFLLRYSAAGQLEWAQLAPGANAAAVAADAGGGVWLAGTFHTNATFGSTQLSRAQRNGFLARYTSQGQPQWARIVMAPGPYAPFVSSNLPIVSSLAAHGTDVYVSGAFGDTVSFAGTQLIAGHDAHGFLARYDAQGTQQWVRHVRASGTLARVSADAAGNAYVGGYFVDTMRPDLPLPPATAQGGDMYVVKYSPQGVAQRVDYAINPGDQLLNGSAVDAAGNVYGTGMFFRGGPVTLADTTLVGGPNFLMRFGTRVLATTSTAPDHLGLYPNPGRAGEQAHLEWTVPAAPGTTLTLRNVLGQELRTQPVAPGSRTASMPTAGLAPGCYLLQLRTPAGSSSGRLVVE